MENKLKEKDSGLYFLCHHKNTPKMFKTLESILKVYKTDDDILTEFIKELHNKEVRDLFSQANIKHLMTLANNRLSDATNLIQSFISSKNANSLLFLLTIIEIRITKLDRKEDLVSLINQMLLDEDFKIIIADNFKKTTKFLNTETLINICLASKNSELTTFIEEILYSENVNELKIQTVRSAVLFLSRNKNCQYEEILEKLILNHISDLQLLIDLKEDMLNSKNREVQIKGGVTDIYDTFYTKYNGVKKTATRKIANGSEKKLAKYDETVLKTFIDSLNSSYINKTDCMNSHFDIISAMLHIDKPQRAEDIFIKSSYKPINKTKRKVELASHCDYITEFAPRLNSNIWLCIKHGYYDLLLTILAAKKIDSLHIDSLHQIIEEINYAINELDGKEAKTCQLILDTILFKISEEKLMIYRTSKQSYGKDCENTHILSKDGALKFVNIVLTNPELKLGEILNQMSESWITKKR